MANIVETVKNYFGMTGKPANISFDFPKSTSAERHVERIKRLMVAYENNPRPEYLVEIQTRENALKEMEPRQ